MEPKDTKVIMPITWEAGCPLKLYDALAGIAVEMMAHRSDLLELVRKAETEEGKELYKRRAADLERYAVAVQSIAFQLSPDRWKDANVSGLLALARQNSVSLPDWMTE